MVPRELEHRPGPHWARTGGQRRQSVEDAGRQDAACRRTARWVGTGRRLLGAVDLECTALLPRILRGLRPGFECTVSGARPFVRLGGTTSKLIAHHCPFATGNVNRNGRPRSWLFSAQSRPPCAAMMLRLIDSPMPSPSRLVV